MVTDDEAIVPAKMDPLELETGCWTCPGPGGCIISMLLLVSGVEVFGRCGRTKKS